MRIQAIVAHPREGSFCHAVFNCVIETLRSSGHELVIHDLYAEKFDPVLTASEAYTSGESVEAALSKSSDPVLARHRQELTVAEGLVVVHPNWWGKPPAILAGWMDRVLVPGVAYRLETAEGEPDGLLSLETALILNTSDTPQAREANVLGDPLHLIWEHCVLPYCGVTKVERQMFGPVAGSDQAQRDNWLDRTESSANICFPPAGR